MKINDIKREVEISFNKVFYKEELVKEAVLAYKNYCSAEIENKGCYLKVKLKAKKKLPLKEIGGEFSNYVLGLIKNE